MTPTTSEREARELLARIRDLLFRADPGCLGDGVTPAGQPYPIRDEVMDAITRALTRQEAQGAVACHRLWSGNAPLMKMWMSGDVPAGDEAKLRIAGYTIERAYTTPPAPVDVRVSRLIKAAREANRFVAYAFDQGIAGAEEAGRNVEFAIALLSGQPAGVDESTWREGWAFAYSGTRLYGDDGELQDNSEQPFIDWRRDSATEILAKIRERANRKIAALGGGGGR